MSRDPKNGASLESPTETQASSRSTARTEASLSTASTGTSRAPYAAPRLRRLGSVRDLTLGSPALPFGDAMGGFQRVPM